MSKKEVDARIAKMPEPGRSAVIKIRKVLQAALPGATEEIYYGIPSFLIDGIGVACFDVYKEHSSYFPMSGTEFPELKVALKKYERTKGSIHFDSKEGLPAPLVKKLVKARIKEINSRFPTKAGLSKSFYDNGYLQSEGKFKNHKLHGAWKWYRKDGSLMRTGNFQNGAQSGIWRTFDRQGNLVKETRF